MCFRSYSDQSLVDQSLVADLMKMIDDHNVLAKSFRRVKDLSTNNLNLTSH